MLSSTNISLQAKKLRKIDRKEAVRAKLQTRKSNLPEKISRGAGLKISKSEVKDKKTRTPNNKFFKKRKRGFGGGFLGSFGENYLLKKAQAAKGTKTNFALSNLKYKLFKKIEHSKRLNLRHTERVLAQIERRTRWNLKKSCLGGFQSKKFGDFKTIRGLKKKLAVRDFKISEKSESTVQNYFFVRNSKELEKIHLYRRFRREKMARLKRSGTSPTKKKSEILNIDSVETKKLPETLAKSKFQNNSKKGRFGINFGFFESQFRNEWSKSPLSAKSEERPGTSSERRESGLKKSTRSSDEFNNPSKRKANAKNLNFRIMNFASDFVASPAPEKSERAEDFEKKKKFLFSNDEIAGKLKIEKSENLLNQISSLAKDFSLDYDEKLLEEPKSLVGSEKKLEEDFEVGRRDSGGKNGFRKNDTRKKNGCKKKLRVITMKSGGKMG